ncbi:MAG: N-acetylneuraminate synthase family protein [Gammaproteobacteria bacterium]|nr:N-acetylneuraminate synthase family protein [Gammaproteobacteria bacterium]
MQIGNINLDDKVMIVAEIGNNHEGDFTLAQEMVGRAAEAGADAVKFQTFIPELYISRKDTGRFERLMKFQLSFEQFESLAQLAKRVGVVFFSTPLDLESAKFLNTIQPIFKIASGDNTFYPLIELVAGFGKPMIVSTGLADLLLIERLHACIHHIWEERGVLPGLALLHCVTNYPVPCEQANLRAIATLKAHFTDTVIGYSDHTIGIEASTYAVAAGARIIEKHFTLDKHHSDFRDHLLSADPLDFRQLVDAIRQVEILLGTGEKKSQPCEEELRPSVRRSIAAAMELPVGTTLEGKHLIWVRSAISRPPADETCLIGRKLVRSLKVGEWVTLGDLA